MPPCPPDSVAEFQGLYGPFACPERVLQKIWLRGEFLHEDARTTDGQSLEVLHTGSWNLAGGPDFRGARVRLDGRDRHGDIEVHFHAADWRAHRHQFDPAFAQVMLHVVLFPPEPDSAPARRADGQALPTLVLLPLLLRDLEEHASDDAIEALTARDEGRLLAELANLAPARLVPLLRRQAARRWEQKVRFARLRLDKLGWHAAAHHAALEILGYRHNRAPMLAVAARFPLERWSDPSLNPATVFAADRLNWHRQGLRPANHPRARLHQYASWNRACPDWPERLVAWGHSLLPPSATAPTTREARQHGGLTAARRQLPRAVLGDALGGTRLDNLVTDGFLPLLAARTGRDLGPAWFHWFLGDIPDQVRRALRRLGLAHPPEQPACHGFAQGLLAWLIERETRASGWSDEC